MSRGHVSWYSDVLGYGFIETPRGDRVLVRATALEARDNGSSRLREGVEVEFSLGSQEGVVEAKHVTPVS
jgi:cold shock CspA family protein